MTEPKQAPAPHTHGGTLTIALLALIVGASAGGSARSRANRANTEAGFARRAVQQLEGRVARLEQVLGVSGEARPRAGEPTLLDRLEGAIERIERLEKK